ncbi:unnamed protein product [Sphenostylis stenocarpa]|uniref:Uncharacterized protein n=1 Tax=Sphenostylis stenocarpa TaxID=92480 RepID=A0AA86SX99_9FABA|nr:unnamed protein product [Sphenostylis stenocarpa]
MSGSKISLSPPLPVSILVDSLLPSRKRLVRPFSFVLHFFVILRFSLRFSDSRDPTLISYLFVSSMFWAAHLVSSAITAGMRLFGCVGFVQIDVCRGRLVLLSLPSTRNPLADTFQWNSFPPLDLRSLPKKNCFTQRYQAWLTFLTSQVKGGQL